MLHSFHPLFIESFIKQIRTWVCIEVGFTFTYCIPVYHCDLKYYTWENIMEHVIVKDKFDTFNFSSVWQQFWN